MSDAPTGGPPAAGHGEPLLLHDRFLTGKVAQGSEAAEIVSQQLVLLGTQLVTQLNVLFKVARTHGEHNAALDRPLASIRSLVKTLGADQPVALRLQEGFIFLGPRHLRATPQQLPIFLSFFDSLAALGIGGLELGAEITIEELRRFAGLFNACEPGELAVEGLQQVLAAEKIANIRLELPRHAVREGKPEGPLQGARGAHELRAATRARATTAYQNAAAAAQAASQAARGTGSMSFRQARRAIQNIVDLLLRDSATVLALTSLRAHDEYTQNHSVNVALLAMALGNRAGFAKADLADLGMAALFHDLGKCTIPLDVLNKPGELSPAEWTQMRAHPSEGVIALVAQRGIAQVPARMAAAAFEHHLNHDGSGYPKLTEPWPQTLTTRVIAVADCYDAMTSARVYRREPLPPPSALALLLKISGTQLDPVLVRHFVTCVGIIPIGTLVLLDTGELAVVLRPSPERDQAERPVVRVIAAADGTAHERPIEVDLRQADPQGGYQRSIVRLIDNTAYRLDTCRYVLD